MSQTRVQFEEALVAKTRQMKLTEATHALAKRASQILHNDMGIEVHHLTYRSSSVTGQATRSWQDGASMYSAVFRFRVGTRSGTALPSKLEVDARFPEQVVIELLVDRGFKKICVEDNSSSDRLFRRCIDVIIAEDIQNKLYAWLETEPAI